MENLIFHFLSDLHLSAETPNINQKFQNYLQNLNADEVQNIYILGDLFDVWIGDDYLEQQNFYSDLSKFIKQITNEKNINLYFLRGNRDFLISQKFSEFSGIKVLTDRYFFDNLPLIISHGDEFCTDDLPFMQFRNISRTQQWQQQILAMPISQRLALAQKIKMQGEADKNGIYKDINENEFCNFIKNLNFLDFPEHKITYIHGHTHIPSEHYYEINGKKIMRWVLADWRENQNFSESFAEISILTLDKNTQKYALKRQQI